MNYYWLLLLVLSNQALAESYDRSMFGSGWIDADRDCQDTRQEVLIRDSLIPVTFKDNKQCQVMVGLWICPYTGKIITNPSDIDIDHTIPLHQVYYAGGNQWTLEQRKAYANDLTHPLTLRATSYSANRSKGENGPESWMPSNLTSWTAYLHTWIELKQYWKLDITDQEQRSIQTLSLIANSNHKGIRILPSGKPIIFE